MYYRISKYDPRLRKDGAYKNEEWTSISDIGRGFRGEILTADQYINVENRYLSCVESILLASHVSELIISRLESYESSPRWENGSKLSGDLLREFLRDGLREKCWAMLMSGDTYLDFGYDYYLHIGCPLEWSDMERIVHAHGMFLEPWHSPEDLLD